MYVPAAFAEQDPATLFALMEKHSFALLVSRQGNEPFASHLPLLVERGEGARGCLLGHVARANPQWQQADGQTVLAIFSGPHAYVSPTWYESENVVPTWNYVAVHVYGVFRAVHDDNAALQIVRRTVDAYEAPMATPWKMDLASGFPRTMIKAVVAFRIEIERIEGKLKLSQNHPEDRREKVARALRASADPDSRQIAALMANRASSQRAGRRQRFGPT